MKEVWKVYHNGPRVTWQVSNQGNVKKNGILYKCRLNCGYKVFGRSSVHRAVAELFIPNPENKPCVDHINGNKLDNRACNLRWVSYKENNNNPITLKRYSEANKGPKNPMYGKSQSEESKKKNSEAHKGKNTGPQSEEHRKHISESLKNKPKSEEHKRKNSEAHKNKHRVYHDDGTYHYEKY